MTVANVLSGALSGAIGTAILEVTDPLERAIAGGPLSFRPENIANRLFGAPRLGPWLRWSYGIGWGVVGSRLGAPQLAAAILGFELVALPPVVGPLRPRTLVALAVHVAAFAVTVATISRLARPARRSSSRGRSG